MPNNTGLTFSAFQKFIQTDVAQITINEINNLIAKNNYLSLYVKVLGEHISSLDKKLDELIILVKEFRRSLQENIASTSKTPLNVVPTHIQRPIDSTDFKVKTFSDLESLIDKKLSCLSTKPIDFTNDN